MIEPRPSGIVQGNSFRLENDFAVYVPNVGLFVFKAGWWFEASIPWFAMWIIRLHTLSSCVLIASCVHDWLYCKKLPSINREKADQIYRDVCVLDDCPRWKASVMYRVLRASGWAAWAKVSDGERAEAANLGSFIPAESEGDTI